MTKFKVLSIDAWAGMEEEGSIHWGWDNWFKFDEIELDELNEETALNYFKEQLSDSSKITEYEIDDDQYNLVLVRKSDRMPILAIEYGSVY